MATKTLNARVQLKQDTLANFQLYPESIYLSGEMLIAKVDDNNTNIYIGDGVTPFKSLQPVFSSTWVFGRSEIDLRTVQIEPSDWVNGKCTKTVTGVLTDETKQFLFPAWSSDSKEYAEIFGVNYIVSNTSELEFSCNSTPTVKLTMYLGILGKTDDSQDDGAYIKTEIDSNFSTSSVNPLENRKITERFNSIESSIREITGQTESGGTPVINETLPEVSEKLTTATTYSLKAPTTIGTYVATDDTESDVKRLKIPFTLTVSRDGMDADSDLSSFTITVTQTLNLETMTNAYWTGKSSNGAFFGSCPIIVTADKKVKLINVPIEETAYTLTGEITIEYV